MWTTSVDVGPQWPESLVNLLRTLEVQEVELQTFMRPQAFLGREVSPEAQQLGRAARLLHKTRGYGFWDEMLNSLPGASQSTRLAVLDRSLQHDRTDVSRTMAALDAFAEHVEQGLYRDLPARTVVSLSSRVVVRGGTHHLPMLDLGTADLPTAVDVLSALDAAGVLVSSGRSFHFVGTSLISEAELVDLLGRAQLLSPLVDHRWAAHQILDRCAALRISTDADRHTKQMTVVARSV